jgi:chemotaxis protein MotA
MSALLGVIVVVLSVLGGFALAGGHVGALLQPSEFLVLGGAAAGAALIGTPGYTLRALLTKLPRVVRGGLRPDDFLSVLVMQFHLYSKLRREGLLAIEADLQDPRRSELFRRSTVFLAQPGAVDFYCDALRQILNGVEPTAVDTAIDIDLATHAREAAQVPAVVARLGDAMPGLGIVAAVLGIVVTMGHLDAPPAELGAHIASALVGTFLGVLLAYGFLNPVASRLEALADEEEQLFGCLAAGLRAFNRGAPPMIAVEFARKAVFHTFRPDSAALENAVRR